MKGKRKLLAAVVLLLLISPVGQRVVFIVGIEIYRECSHSDVACLIFPDGICKNHQESCSAYALRRSFEEPIRRPTFVGKNNLLSEISSQRGWFQDTADDNQDGDCCPCDGIIVEKKKEKKPNKNNWASL